MSDIAVCLSVGDRSVEHSFPFDEPHLADRPLYSLPRQALARRATAQTARLWLLFASAKRTAMSRHGGCVT